MSGAKDTADVPPKAPSAADEFWQGVRDELPLMFGVIPFGLVFGVIGIESGLTICSNHSNVINPIWRC